MKKIKKIGIVLCMTVAVMLSGCLKMPIQIQTPNTANTENIVLPIYNLSNEQICEIEHCWHTLLVGNDIIYGKIINNSGDSEFYRYNIKTNENIKLGTVKEMAHQAPQRALIDNHLYLSVTTGPLLDADNREVKVIDIDLDSNTLSETMVMKGSFPYNYMAAVGDKLFVADITHYGTDIKSYDPKTKEVKIAKSFEFDYDKMTGEATRGMYFDGETFYMLVLKMESETNFNLRMEAYDKDMNLLNTWDVEKFARLPDRNELRQPVAHFVVENGYVFYENYSSSRFLGEINGDDIEPILYEESKSGHEFLKAIQPVEDDDNILFYDGFHQDNNRLYLFDKVDGSVKSVIFNSPDDANESEPRFIIRSILRNEKNDLVIFMSFKDIENKRFVYKTYYTNISELDFEDYTPLPVTES